MFLLPYNPAPRRPRQTRDSRGPGRAGAVFGLGLVQDLGFWWGLKQALYKEEGLSRNVRPADM